jgi:sortase (surface protein transpeptidase)
MARGKHRRRRTKPVLVLDAAAIGLSLIGLLALGFGRFAAGSPPPLRVSGTVLRPEASTKPAVPAPPTPATQPARTPRHGAPVDLSIPAIGVQTRLVRLGLNPDGSLEVPTDFSVAGWYRLGPKPGQPGAAVIAGHVDNTEGPAVFYRLGELAPGDLIRVRMADGSMKRFHVYAVREYPKTAFPTSLVYGATPNPELRLVTCGGPFDSNTGHYLDNIVVFAR